MENLAPETLIQIANYFRGDGRALVQLGLVSRRWQNVIAHFLYTVPQFNRGNSFELFYRNLTEANGELILELDLHEVPGNYREDMNDNLQQIIPRMPQLQLLNLDLCFELSNEVLILAAETLSNLVSLSLDHCYRIEDRSMVQVLQHCTRLTELHLGGALISDATLMAMTIHAPQLTHLHLIACPLITEIGVRAVITEQNNLQHLEIKQCSRVVGNFDDIIHNLEVFDYVQHGPFTGATFSFAPRNI